MTFSGVRSRFAAASRLRAALPLTAAALALSLVAAACSSEAATPTKAPAPTSVPAVGGAFKIATSPTTADLGGGSPQAFAKLFETGVSTSKYPPASTFAAASKVPAGQKLKIGFIYVGSRADLGYNQAAYEGSQWLEKALSGRVELLHAENIPETAQVASVEEQMISQGAKIIFATSYGYSATTKEVAKKHPDVVFLHQGDVESLQNYGAYFGNIWQLEYAAGQVAGKATKSNKLGFIAAFPIPQTLLNVSGYQLGAKSVNPNATTTFVLLSDWCDPAKQTAAVKTMLDAGVDVITQHQDCTKTIVDAAERNKIYVTGYHQDGSAVAPTAWLTGAAWNWGPVYTELVSEIMNGTYKANVMFGNLDAGWFKLAPFGKSVSPDLQKLVTDTVEGLRSGAVRPFKGPVVDQDGKTVVPAGANPSDTELQTVGWLVQGVTGSAKS